MTPHHSDRTAAKRLIVGRSRVPSLEQANEMPIVPNAAQGQSVFAPIPSPNMSLPIPTCAQIPFSPAGFAQLQEQVNNLSCQVQYLLSLVRSTVPSLPSQILPVKLTLPIPPNQQNQDSRPPKNVSRNHQALSPSPQSNHQSDSHPSSRQPIHQSFDNKNPRPPGAKRSFTTLPATQSEILKFLLEHNLVQPIPPKQPPNPLPRWYDPTVTCAYHSGELGHTTDLCFNLKHKIQELIDQDVITFDHGPKIQNTLQFIPSASEKNLTFYESQKPTKNEKPAHKEAREDIKESQLSEIENWMVQLRELEWPTLGNNPIHISQDVVPGRSEDGKSITGTTNVQE